MGISSYAIRQLCQHGLIEAEYSGIEGVRIPRPENPPGWYLAGTPASAPCCFADTIWLDGNQGQPLRQRNGAQSRYLAIADDYDAELAEAHRAGDRAADAMVHFRCVREIGPAMLDALKRYQDAVALLAEAVD